MGETNLTIAAHTAPKSVEAASAAVWFEVSSLAATTCVPVALPDAIADALGGTDNVRTVRALHGRYRVEFTDAARIDEGALTQLTRGIVRPQPGICHILI